MSYILDALRKAERERGIAQVPTLMTVHESGAAKPHQRTWITAAILLACFAVLLWIVVSFLRSSGASPDRHINDLKNAVRVKTDPESSAADADSTPPLGPAANPEKGASRKTRISGSTPPAEAPPALNASHPESAQDRQKPESSAQQPSSATQPQENLKRIPPPPAQGTAIPEVSQPAEISLREAMAKMKITILLYDESRSERMVFINNQKYLEGDYIDGRYLLESITLEGAVLSYKGEQVLLRASVK
jgi:general secretion pathway protein B